MDNPREQAYQHNLLACSLLDRGKIQAALKEFARAITLDPAAPSYISNRGLAKYRMKDYQGAMRDLQEAIKRDRSYSPARAILGDVFRTLGRHTDALESYRAALDLGDKDAEGIQSMMRKCEDQLSRMHAGPEVVGHRVPFKTGVNEKRFLGCLAVWALIVAAVLIVVLSTDILKSPASRLDEVVAEYSEAMWEDARRLVRDGLKEADNVTFPRKPSYMPVDEETKKLELISHVEYETPPGKKVRKGFKYDVYYADDGKLHDGKVTFFDVEEN